MRRPAARMETTVWFSVAVIAAATSLASSCSWYRMRVPPELESSAESWEVERKTPFFFWGELHFGPYAALDYEREWGSSTSSARSAVGTTSTSCAPYRFDLVALGGPTDAIAVACESCKWEHRADLGALLRGWSVAHSTRRLVCAIGDTGSLAMDEVEPQPFEWLRVEGSVVYGGARLELESWSQTEQGSLAVAGFVVRSGARAIAAVQTVSPKLRVWMERDLTPDTRTAVAAAASALLLQHRW